MAQTSASTAQSEHHRRGGGALPILGLTLLGGVLRFAAIHSKTIWLDEAFSIWVANQSPTAIIDWLVRIDQHPPLYYLLLAPWIALFGDLQGPVRALSALCGTLTIPLLYLIAWRISRDRWTALLTGLILAIAPFHVRFAQEARMYALLTLLAAGAILGTVCLLQRADPLSLTWRDWIDPRRWRTHPAVGAALLVALCQAGVMWTHNTATVFFPLALNLPILGAVLMHHVRGGPSSMAAVNQPHFLRNWLQVQGVAFLFWLPWLLPFLLQARGVDREFWIPPPDWAEVIETQQSFSFAHLPRSALNEPLVILYLSLALMGLFSLRRSPAWAGLLASLWLTPFLGELLVSLRRPIFYDRTLIWTTLAFYLLMALGIRSIGLRRQAKGNQSWADLSSWAKGVQAALAFTVVLTSGVALWGYFRYFEKEGWADAATYVAARSEPGDLILFNATWVQLPFEYYYRHYGLDTPLRGVPSDLFSSGQLEPKMRPADLARLHDLIDDHERVWLVYSHDWYTDPDGLIPRTLSERMTRHATVPFTGLQVMQYETRN